MEEEGLSNNQGIPETINRKTNGTHTIINQ